MSEKGTTQVPFFMARSRLTTGALVKIVAERQDRYP